MDWPLNNISQKGRFVVTAFFLFFCVLASAQQDHKGRVIDGKTGAPIPYVNIGIQERNVGTVSNEEGIFHLVLTQFEPRPDELILFSALGYESLEIAIKDFPMVFNTYPDFKMKPSPLALNEVVVSNREGRFIPDNIGYRNYGEQDFGYWKDNIALGGELATRIFAKTGLRRLERLQFEVFHNPSDSLLLRANIYDDDGSLGRPNTNLNTSKKNILVTVKKDDHIKWVDLQPYDIYVKDDFMVSLELLQVYGNEELGLLLAAASSRYGSYRKYASQAKWKRINDRNMAYYLETSLMVPDKVADRYERRTAKKKKKARTLSGFTIERGRMLSNVQVLNQRTKDQVMTDEKGRYTIEVRKNDLLRFSKEGYKTLQLQVADKLTANIIMKARK